MATNSIKKAWKRKMRRSNAEGRQIWNYWWRRWGKALGLLVGAEHLLLLQAPAPWTWPHFPISGTPCPHPPQGPRGWTLWLLEQPQLYLSFEVLCPVVSPKISLCFFWKHEWKAPAAAYCSLQKLEKFESFPSWVNSKVFSELSQAQKYHGNVFKCG